MSHSTIMDSIVPVAIVGKQLLWSVEGSSEGISVVVGNGKALEAGTAVLLPPA